MSNSRFASPSRAEWISLVGVVSFCVLAFGFPLAVLFAKALGSPLWLSADITGVAQFTAYQAALSASVSGVIGYPLGVWMHRRPALRPALEIPFVLPTIVVATLWVSTFGVSGWLPSMRLIYSFEAVIAAHVFLNAPWIAGLVATSMDSIPAPEIEAARTLGARGGRRLREIIWPRTRWAFASAVFQAYSLSAMSFVIVLLLGGGPPVETLQTSIYARVRAGTLDLDGAMACALWLVIMTTVPWGALIACSPTIRDSAVASARRRVPNRSGRPALLGGLCAVALLLMFQSRYSIFVSIFSEAEFWIQVANSLGTTLFLAVGATCVGFAVAAAGVVASRRWRSVGILLAFPSGLAVMVLGLGIWLAYVRWVDPFDGSFIALILIQSVNLLPIAYRKLWPVSLSEPRMQLEAARTLGATPWRTFMEVEWPRWRRPVIATGMLLLALSIGEVAAYSLFALDAPPPLAVLLTQWMGRYEFEKAQCLGLLLMIGCASLILVSESVDFE